MPFARPTPAKAVKRNVVWLNSGSQIVDKFATEASHGAGIQTRSDHAGIRHLHDHPRPAHADMPHEVTVIKGRRFPTCRYCKGISFELAHAAKHAGQIDHLEAAHAPAQ
jgi:hypothetical protein